MWWFCVFACLCHQTHEHKYIIVNGADLFLTFLSVLLVIVYQRAIPSQGSGTALFGIFSAARLRVKFICIWFTARNVTPGPMATGRVLRHLD
jgi:hypothetical protein